MRPMNPINYKAREYYLAWQGLQNLVFEYDSYQGGLDFGTSNTPRHLQYLMRLQEGEAKTERLRLELLREIADGEA